MAKDPNMDAPKHTVDDASMGYGDQQEIAFPTGPEMAHHTQTERRVPYGRPDPHEAHA